MTEISRAQAAQAALDAKAAQGRRFGAVLAEMRQQRRWSQSRLAVAAGCDHSYICRLEQGARLPSRRFTEQLLDALTTDPKARATLRQAAGYAPDNLHDLVEHEPVVGQLADLLADATVDPAIRGNVRVVVEALIWQARRAAEGDTRGQ